MEAIPLSLEKTLEDFIKENLKDQIFEECTEFALGAYSFIVIVDNPKFFNQTITERIIKTIELGFKSFSWNCNANKTKIPTSCWISYMDIKDPHIDIHEIINGKIQDKEDFSFIYFITDSSFKNIIHTYYITSTIKCIITETVDNFCDRTLICDLKKVMSGPGLHKATELLLKPMA